VFTQAFQPAIKRAVHGAIYIPGAVFLFLVFVAVLALFACQIFAPELVERLFEMIRQ
jgi:hypothetical protein